MTDKLDFSIPYPTDMGYRRGLSGPTGGGRIVAMRIDTHDYDLITETAQHYGMAPTVFMRWVIVWACQSLHAQRTGKKVFVNP